MGAFGISAMGAGIGRGLQDLEDRKRRQAQEARTQRSFEMDEEDRARSQKVDSALLRFEATGDAQGLIDFYNEDVDDGDTIISHQMQEDGKLRIWTNPGEFQDLDRETLAGAALSFKQPGFMSKWKLAQQEAQRSSTAKQTQEGIRQSGQTARTEATQAGQTARTEVTQNRMIKQTELQEQGKDRRDARKVSETYLDKDGHPVLVYGQGKEPTAVTLTDVTVPADQAEKMTAKMKEARDIAEAFSIPLDKAYDKIFQGKTNTGTEVREWFELLKESKKYGKATDADIMKEAEEIVKRLSGAGEEQPGAGVSGVQQPTVDDWLGDIGR